MNIEEFTAKIEEGRDAVLWGAKSHKVHPYSNAAYRRYAFGCCIAGEKNKRALVEEYGWPDVSESSFLDWVSKEMGNQVPQGGVLWWRTKPVFSIEDEGTPDERMKVTFRCYIEQKVFPCVVSDAGNRADND